MPLDEDVKQLLAFLVPPGAPELHEVGVEQARKNMLSMLDVRPPPEPVARVEDRTIPGPAGAIPVRIYWPSETPGLPILVYFHGGGWVLCNLDTHDATCRSLARETPCIVVSVDYRLAPEHKFPAAVEDCHAAAKWAAENARSLGGDPARVAIAGDSAGGNLTASVALVARERGGPNLVHQLMIYPVTDARMSSASYRDNAEGFFLSAAAMRWFWEQYLPTPPDGANPHASPLRAEHLAGLPPATVITAEMDPLRDEGEAYGRRLAEAGVPSEVRRYDGVIHGFFGMTLVLEKARDAMSYAAKRLRESFGTS